MERSDVIQDYIRNETMEVEKLNSECISIDAKLEALTERDCVELFNAFMFALFLSPLIILVISIMEGKESIPYVGMLALSAAAFIVWLIVTNNHKNQLRRAENARRELNDLLNRLKDTLEALLTHDLNESEYLTKTYGNNIVINMSSTISPRSLFVNMCVGEVKNVSEIYELGKEIDKTTSGLKSKLNEFNWDLKISIEPLVVVHKGEVDKYGQTLVNVTRYRVFAHELGKVVDREKADLDSICYDAHVYRTTPDKVRTLKKEGH